MYGVSTSVQDSADYDEVQDSADYDVLNGWHEVYGASTSVQDSAVATKNKLLPTVALKPSVPVRTHVSQAPRSVATTNQQHQHHDLRINGSIDETEIDSPSSSRPRVDTVRQELPASLENSINRRRLVAPRADTTLTAKKLQRNMIAVGICLVLSVAAIGLYGSRANVTGDGASTSSQVHCKFLRQFS